MKPSITLLSEVPLESYSARAKIDTPEGALAIVRDMLTGLDRECGIVVSVDNRHRVLGIDTVSVGTVSNTFLAPREVFRTALARGASALLVAHNHPSGDATPSEDDRIIARRLAAAGDLLGIDLLDALVLGDDGWTSQAREGWR